MTDYPALPTSLFGPNPADLSFPHQYNPRVGSGRANISRQYTRAGMGQALDQAFVFCIFLITQNNDSNFQLQNAHLSPPFKLFKSLRGLTCE